MHLIKNLIYIALVSILLFAHLTVAQDAQKRNSLLAKRAGNNKNIFQKTTTTTAEPVYEDEEYPEGIEVESEDHEEDHSSTTTTTTTEAAKKMIRPSVRPMRSNEDLLSALKKRRLDAKNNKPAATQKPVQEEKHYEQPEVKPTKPKTTAAPISSNNRRFGGHKSTNVRAPVSDNTAQNIEEQPQAKSFRPPNRFSRLK